MRSINSQQAVQLGLVASRTIDHRAGAQANAVLGEAGHGVQLPHQHSRAQKGWAEARHGWSRAEGIYAFQLRPDCLSPQLAVPLTRSSNELDLVGGQG